MDHSDNTSTERNGASNDIGGQDDWFDSNEDEVDKDKTEYWEKQYATFKSLSLDAAMVAEAPLEFLVKVMKHRVEDRSRNEDSAPIGFRTCANPNHNRTNERNQITGRNEESINASEEALEHYTCTSAALSITQLTMSFQGLPSLEQNEEFTWEVMKGGVHGKPHMSTLRLNNNTFSLTYTKKNGCGQTIHSTDIVDIVHGCHYGAASGRTNTPTHRRKTTSTTSVKICPNGTLERALCSPTSVGLISSIDQSASIPHPKEGSANVSEIKRSWSGLGTALTGVQYRLHALACKLAISQLHDSTQDSHMNIVQQLTHVKIAQEDLQMRGGGDQHRPRSKSFPRDSSTINRRKRQRSVQAMLFGGLDESRSFTLICGGENKVFQVLDKETRAHCVAQLVAWLQHCKRGSSCSTASHR